VLNVGQAYNDPDAAVTITALSGGSTGATVRLDFGIKPCVPDDPVPVLSPSSAQWLPVGSAASYTVTVTNKDSSSCANATFDLQAAVPDGWLAAFDHPSLTLAPGASASATLTIWPPSNVTAGFYSFPVTSTNRADPSYAASVAATEVLVDSLAVGVSFDRNPPVYARNKTVAISTVVGAPDGNGGTVGAVGASVTLTIQKPAAKGSVTVTGTTDSSGKFVYSLKVKANDPTGTWQVQVGATKGGITGSASTSFTVQ
jgi:uncharacterized protein YfaS (alpha-2-macroglobulin family)